LGEYEAARRLDEDTFVRCRRVRGEDQPHTLTSADNLAHDLCALGDYPQAREFYKDILERCREC
jgi:hypothetical protein